MSGRPGPFELWQQAGGGTPTYSRETYHRLMVEHGHLVPRPACTCGDPADPAMHLQDCPRYQNNDQRLACGWLPGEPRPLTVVITGDRNWRHPTILKMLLGGLAIGFLPGFELLIGDCPTGADAQALDLARSAGWPHRVFHARWNDMQAEGKPRAAAGPLRNREMLDALEASPGERLVVAFHDHLDRSKGTKNCVHQAQDRGLPIYLVSKLWSGNPIPPALRSGEIKAYMCNWCGTHLEVDATIPQRDLGPCPACKWEGNTKGWWPAHPREFDLTPVVDIQTGGQL